jgi:chromosome segregation ATPase
LEPESSPQDQGDKPGYDTLLNELEQEREERRRLEQRAASLTAQVSALHLQVGENLDIESRNQKKVAALEEQLRESRTQVTQLKSDLASERQKTTLAEEKAEAANAVAASITEQLEALKVLHEALGRTQAESESQLKTVSSELHESQNALSAETAKRQELELALTRAQQQRLESDRNSRLELSKLETVLKEKELELKDVQSKHAQAALQAKS